MSRQVSRFDPLLSCRLDVLRIFTSVKKIVRGRSRLGFTKVHSDLRFTHCPLSYSLRAISIISAMFSKPVLFKTRKGNLLWWTCVLRVFFSFCFLTNQTLHNTTPCLNDPEEESFKQMNGKYKILETRTFSFYPQCILTYM